MTAIDDEIDFDLLMSVFLAEAQELLQQYEGAVVDLERSPGNDELINTIFRVAHTMKGNAATVGDDAIVEVAHAAEDLLHQLRAHRFGVTPDLITLLLACGDHLRTLVDHAMKKSATPIAADAALVAALRDASTTGTSEHTAHEADSSAQPGNGRHEATMRTSVARLDGMLAIAGEISIARSRLRTLIAATQSIELRDAQEQLDRLCADLESDLMRIRMVPVGPVLNQQTRLVRDLALASQKLVELQCLGNDVEADTAVIEQMRAPLTHMVRNAIDHGIETADVRRRAGKPEVGTITIRAAHDAGMLVLEVSDDGAGLDSQRILSKARRLGLTQSSELAEAEIHRLIFRPGFTTSETVTEVSGRGVGMDIVHQWIVGLRGSVAVSSTPGAGTTFIIRVPLSVAIIDALAVRAGLDTYVVPLESVIECIDVDESALRGERAGLLDVRGRAIPFVRLAACMGSDGDVSDRKSAVIVTDRKAEAALILDRLLGRVDAVVKPLHSLPRVAGVGGATILGDGSVALILDIPRLMQKEIREVA